MLCRHETIVSASYQVQRLWSVSGLWLCPKRGPRSERRVLGERQRRERRVRCQLVLEKVQDSATPGLDRNDAYQRRAAVPPQSEQIAIAVYFDQVDRRIQRYISAEKQLIGAT